MAHEHDSSDEAHDAVVRAVEAAAADITDEPVLVTGYALIGEYIAGDGEHLWTIRHHPDTGVVQRVGLCRLLAFEGDRMAAITIGTDELGDD